MLNQLISSATNFVVGFYLLRMLPPAEFGLFGVGFAIILFFGGIGNALLLIHMVVQIPHKSPSIRKVYVARMLMALLAFCIFSVLVVGGGVILASLLSTAVIEYLTLAIAISAASLPYLLKDFFIRYAYSEQKENWALKINLMIAATTASSFLLFHIDSAEKALWIYAAGQLGGVVAGFVLAKLPVSAVELPALRLDLHETWNAGRWNVSANIINWVRTQAYVTFTAGIAGPAGVAILNAVRLLFTPVIFLLPAVGQLALPRLATLGVYDRQGVTRIGFQVIAAILAVTFGYSTLLLIFFKPVATIILGAEYKTLDHIAFAWVSFLVVHIIAVGSTLILQALRQYSAVAVSGAVGTIFMLAVLYPLYWAFNLGGIIFSMAVGEFAIAALVCWKISRLKQ